MMRGQASQVFFFLEPPLQFVAEFGDCSRQYGHAFNGYRAAAVKITSINRVPRLAAAACRRQKSPDIVLGYKIDGVSAWS